MVNLMLVASVQPALRGHLVLQELHHARIVRQIKYLLLALVLVQTVLMGREPHQYVLEFVRMV